MKKVHAAEMYQHGLAIRQQMTITLFPDHRAVDGVLAAELLATFKAYMEEPGLMLV